MLNETLHDAQRRMHTAVEVVERELRTLRTGRANISILDDIHVDYYGTQTPLNQLSSLSSPEPQLLVVQPFDKGSIAAIEKAIMQSDLGLNPNNDGTIVRIPIPALTEERRVELAKHVNKYAEEGKTAVRNVRRDANEQIKKLQADKELSEDDEHRAHDKIQELTDKYCADIDTVADAKREELLTI